MIQGHQGVVSATYTNEKIARLSAICAHLQSDPESGEGEIARKVLRTFPGEKADDWHTRLNLLEDLHQWAIQKLSDPVGLCWYRYNDHEDRKTFRWKHQDWSLALVDHGPDFGIVGFRWKCVFYCKALEGFLGVNGKVFGFSDHPKEAVGDASVHIEPQIVEKILERLTPAIEYDAAHNTRGR